MSVLVYYDWNFCHRHYFRALMILIRPFNQSSVEHLASARRQHAIERTRPTAQRASGSGARVLPPDLHDSHACWEAAMWGSEGNGGTDE